MYLRQSSQAQLERNVESTARQYALVERAIELGFAREQIVVIDEDLGISGSGPSDAVRVRAAGGRGRARARRTGARPGGLPPGAQQRLMPTSA